MLYINNTYTNPYFNLAAEEYVLKHFDDDCFMLWRNEPAIIVGKNQNTLSEINIDYILQHSIPVVRRLSGGGAVFHDLGNLNFTFISSDSEDSFSDFQKFAQPVIDVLSQLSIQAKFSGRNDLTIDGMKFSGNAQYYHENKVLHHGTLLYASNMSDLARALRVKPDKFKDKSIKSVSSRVTNISQHLIHPLSINQFRELIMEHIMMVYGKNNLYSFTDDDIKAITGLAKEKYNTWDWNYGRSPKYSFRNEKRFTGGSVELNMTIRKGIITDIKFFGDFFSKYDLSELEGALIGTNHSKNAIRQVLSTFNLSNYFSNITLNDLIELFI